MEWRQHSPAAINFDCTAPLKPRGKKTVLEDVFLEMILLEVASIFNSMGLT